MRPISREKNATKLQSVEEAPELLREAMLPILKSEDAIQLLLLSPTLELPDGDSAATLLGVLETGWIVASMAKNLTPSTVRVSFAETLSVEFSLGTVFGRVKLDYAANGAAQSAFICFHSAMEPLFKEAVRLLLNGIDGIASGPPTADGRLNILLQGIPAPFRNAAHEFRPFSQCVLAVRYWPAAIAGCVAWFRREWRPKGMMLLTERELILILQTKTKVQIGLNKQTHGGHIATYCPLSRLQTWCIEKTARLIRLELNLCTDRGGLTIQTELPRPMEQYLRDFMELTMEQRKAVDLTEPYS